jgi:hypothetical protein
MQIMRMTAAPSMGRRHRGIAISALLWIPLSVGALAQTDVVPAASLGAPVIPQQMRFGGTAPNRAGDTVEAVFRIYAAPQGGEPLWTETQQITIDAKGKYSVLLGAATHGGLPQTLFAGGQARWLGVSIERAEELPRSPLTSVAYAMKAGDAETVGGIGAGRFVTQEQLTALSRTVAAQTAQAVLPDMTPAGSGTANYLPIWSNSTTLGDSMVYQSGKNIGVGTVNPASALQVYSGDLTIGPAALKFPATPGGIASINQLSGGFLARMALTDGSGRLNLYWNAYNDLATSTNRYYGSAEPAAKWNVGGVGGAGGTALYVAPSGAAGGVIHWNTVLSSDANANVSLANTAMTLKPGGNVGIGTPTPAAKLEVNGTAKFDGLVTFAPAQTFPGNGTITGITTTSPLTGSGSSGSVALGLNTSALETTLNGAYAQLGAQNTFAQNQTFNNAITASGSGIAGYFSNQSAANPTIYAINTADQTTAGIPVALSATANGHGSTHGVYGNGTIEGVVGESSTSVGTGVEGIGGSNGDGVSGLGGFAGVVGENTITASVGELGTYVNKYDTGVYGNAGTYGVFGSGVTYGVVGESTNYIGVYGQGPTYGLYSDGPVGSSAYSAAVAALPDNRVVEFYSVSSTENWVEDYGSSRLRNGAVAVILDPTYAQAVNTDGGYHVFLTPKGDCEGLYVTGETATGFEVRELRAGKSNIEFDYRVVARRRGFEGVRMQQLDADAETVEQIRGRVGNLPAHRTLTLRRPPEPRRGIPARPNAGIPPQPGILLAIPSPTQPHRLQLLPARPNAPVANPAPKPAVTSSPEK